MYKLFIVEDDRGIAEEIKKLSEAWQLEAKICDDFANVTKEFVEFAPHIVLLDISLPFFNGFYWCGEIRKASNVPIIFISSSSDNMNIVMAMNMGGDDFISKPFEINVLIAKIQALLRRSYDFAVSPPLLADRSAILNKGENTC